MTVKLEQQGSMKSINEGLLVNENYGHGEINKQVRLICHPAMIQLT